MSQTRCTCQKERSPLQADCAFHRGFQRCHDTRTAEQIVQLIQVVADQPYDKAKIHLTAAQNRSIISHLSTKETAA